MKLTKILLQISTSVESDIEVIFKTILITSVLQVYTVKNWKAFIKHYASLVVKKYVSYAFLNFILI